MQQRSVLRNGLMLSSFLVAVGYGAGPAVAQSVFCTPPPNSTATLVGGICTLNVPGGVGSGFTVAALASEALNDIVQASTSSSIAAVRERRIQEAEQCPEGFERLGGECRRVGSRPATAAPARPISVQRARPAAAPRPEGFVKAAPVPYIAPGPAFAIWTQGFGDYEKRTNLSPGAVETLTVDGGGNAVVTAPVDLTRKTTTVGVLGGADVTFRGVFGAGDGLIVGLLGGFMRSNISFSGLQTATVSARVEGPSVGAYVSYFNGAFSGDLAFKADLLTLDESFAQNIAISNGTFAVLSGNPSVRMNDYNIAGNLNYKFDLGGPLFSWVEPTVGFRYTRTDYGDGAAELGLADGDNLRVQGGARFGTDFMWGAVRVTPTVTGLVYSDVIVTGLVAQTSPTGLPIGVVPSDEGKIRGEGIFALSFDYGNGLSSFALAEVRGGQDLFGAGGKAGLRFQW
jgi:hypothetical protein